MSPRSRKLEPKEKDPTASTIARVPLQLLQCGLGMWKRASLWTKLMGPDAGHTHGSFPAMLCVSMMAEQGEMVPMGRGLGRNSGDKPL